MNIPPEVAQKIRELDSSECGPVAAMEEFYVWLTAPVCDQCGEAHTTSPTLGGCLTGRTVARAEYLRRKG